VAASSRLATPVMRRPAGLHHHRGRSLLGEETRPPLRSHVLRAVFCLFVGIVRVRMARPLDTTDARDPILAARTERLFLEIAGRAARRLR